MYQTSFRRKGSFWIKNPVAVGLEGVTAVVENDDNGERAPSRDAATSQRVQ
jgi:hypothetical protein